MQSMQETLQNPQAGSNYVRQMEDLARTLSATSLLGGLPGASLPHSFPWAHFQNMGGSIPAFNPQPANPPALGIAREFQEDWNKLTVLQQEYSTALRAFGELFDDFARRANEKFINSISSDKEATDFISLCRQWIDCCEIEFQSIAQTADFSSRLGAMINTSLRLTRHTHRIHENLAKLQGQPTRSELDELHLRNAQAQTKIDRLEERIQQLESAKPSKRKSPSRSRKTTGRPSK